MMGSSSLIGQPISHYRILEEIGGEGRDVVCQAQDTRLDRSVALKFLPDEVAKNPQASRHFRRVANSVGMNRRDRQEHLPSMLRAISLRKTTERPFFRG